MNQQQHPEPNLVHGLGLGRMCAASNDGPVRDNSNEDQMCFGPASDVYEVRNSVPPGVQLDAPPTALTPA